MTVLKPDLLEMLHADGSTLACNAATTITALEEALSFYANREAWNRPPVQVSAGLFGPEYTNAAYAVQKDRGRIAREALENLKSQ